MTKNIFQFDAYFKLVKPTNAKSKTRHEFEKRAGEYQPFSNESWVYLTQGRSNYKKLHKTIEPEYSLSGRESKHISSVFFPMDNLILGYGNNKYRKEDLFVFIMNPMKQEFEVFVSRGNYKEKLHILNLIDDGELDEELSRCRNNGLQSAA